jgi:hypothetical protein
MLPSGGLSCWQRLLGVSTAALVRATRSIRGVQADVAPVGRDPDLATTANSSPGVTANLRWYGHRASPSAGLAWASDFIAGEVDIVLRSVNMGTRP